MGLGSNMNANVSGLLRVKFLQRYCTVSASTKLFWVIQNAGLTIAKRLLDSSKIKTLTHDMKLFLRGEELDQRKAGSHLKWFSLNWARAIWIKQSGQDYFGIWTGLGHRNRGDCFRAGTRYSCFHRGFDCFKYDEDLAQDVSILYGGSVSQPMLQPYFHSRMLIAD